MSFVLHIDQQDLFDNELCCNSIIHPSIDQKKSWTWLDSCDSQIFPIEKDLFSTLRRNNFRLRANQLWVQAKQLQANRTSGKTTSFRLAQARFGLQSGGLTLSRRPLQIVVSCSLFISRLNHIVHHKISQLYCYKPRSKHWAITVKSAQHFTSGPKIFLYPRAKYV